MIYPGITYVGTNKFSGLYGLNETIVDQKGMGLQHLYIDNYERDLAHSACSVVKYENQVYYADRIKSKIGHPRKHKSYKSYVKNNCFYLDEFKYENFNKFDSVGVYEDFIYFETCVKNTSLKENEFRIASLFISRPGNSIDCEVNGCQIYQTINDKHILVLTQHNHGAYMSVDSPSGFMYKGIENILFDMNKHENHIIEDRLPVASSLYIDVKLLPGESYTFKWAILIGDSGRELEKKSNQFDFQNRKEIIREYWKQYLSVIRQPYNYENEIKTKLVALKGALLDGLLPADLTGHYFSDNEVCCYTRDALMGSRAFLYAGLISDFESIIKFLIQCERKDNNELYQRYNYLKKPDEGANNNVNSQIDFIGYITRVVADYYHLSNKLICSLNSLDSFVSILNSQSRKNGLYGPEGGVNEGVYGPAYIISTNMFIAGGLYSASKMAGKMNRPIIAKKWFEMMKSIVQSIEEAFLDGTYYPYGYVDYHDDIVRRYDTPQLMAAALGYPLTEKYYKSYNTLLEVATYHKWGIGYSEQEYHDGAWVFNTAAAAEVAYLAEDFSNYDKFMEWIVNHHNAYGLSPEAVDSSNEHNAFINPLMWANSEFICAAYIHIIKSLGGYNDIYLHKQS